MAKIMFKEESYQIIGACMEVHNEMGCGFLEAVYQECLGLEFDIRTIPVESEKQLVLRFKNIQLKSTYVPDFICFDQIVVEIKGVSDLNDKHRAQTINYLKATGLKLGLLVNFGNHAGLQYERIVY